jgi:hypothetical protein
MGVLKCFFHAAKYPEAREAVSPWLFAAITRVSSSDEQHIRDIVYYIFISIVLLRLVRWICICNSSDNSLISTLHRTPHAQLIRCAI